MLNYILGATLLTVVQIPETTPSDLIVCHIANAGFIAKAGDKAILVDALIEKDAYQGSYALPSKETLNRMLANSNEFSNVKLALATHMHSDHFDASATVKHMKQNPKVRYVVTPQSYNLLIEAGADKHIEQAFKVSLPQGKPTKISHEGIEIEVFAVKHGEGMPENFGYKVTINGKSIFHTGDINTSFEILKNAGLNKTPTDVLLIPFWYLFEHGNKVTDIWDAKHIIPTHFMAKEQAWMKRYGGLKGVKEKALNSAPNTTLIANELECKTF